ILRRAHDQLGRELINGQPNALVNAPPMAAVEGKAALRQTAEERCAIRAHLAEFGIVAPVGRNGVEHLLGVGTFSEPRLRDRIHEYTAQPSTWIRQTGYSKL
ncbi:MAG: hypothetical protein ACREB8_15870, partial [Pseudolabrys sp.]